MEKQFFSVNEVATMLAVHYNTIIKLILSRKLTAVKVAGAWRVSQVALDEYINKNSVKAV
jgi:excisionase family DNA binding protein